MNYHDLSKKELESLHASLSERFERVKSERLSLDLTRGKPAADQLDLSNDLDRDPEGVLSTAGWYRRSKLWRYSGNS